MSIKLKSSMSQIDYLYHDVEGYVVTKKMNRTALKNLLYDYEILYKSIEETDIFRKLKFLDGCRMDLSNFSASINTGRTKLVEVDKKCVTELLINTSKMINILLENAVEVIV